jgi:hypothetical protein
VVEDSTFVTEVYRKEEATSFAVMVRVRIAHTQAVSKLQPRR